MKNFGKAWVVLIVILVVLLLVGLAVFSWYINGYNRAVNLEKATERAWADIDAALQRRLDLVPNLVSTVKGYATHEKELFENIAKARTLYFQAKDVKDKVKASNQLEGVLSRLLLLQERYPELKANESFLKLQDSLEGTENRIAVERKRYNDSVQILNTYIRTFFGRFYAMIAGVSSAAYYEVPEAEKAAPKVTF